MSAAPTELKIPFSVPGVDKECFTWCKIFGALEGAARRPLVVVHGGPGMCHDYLLPLADLSAAGTVVVFYDQLGGGRSTHLPERTGDTAFWTEELFMAEVDNPVRHLGIQDNYSLLGQSWGGMLASRHASRRPKGLQRLIISDSPANMRLFEKGAHDDLIPKLPPDVRVCSGDMHRQL